MDEKGATKIFTLERQREMILISLSLDYNIEQLLRKLV